MIIVKAILEIGGDSNETQEADILMKDYNDQNIIKMLNYDEVALADIISDELGFCVNEIIGYKEVDYII